MIVPVPDDGTRVPRRSMIPLSFIEVAQAIAAYPLPECDAVVAIGTGGVVPAALVAYRLMKPLFVIEINYRDETNAPRHSEPALLNLPQLPTDARRLLLVDDVSVSGQTLSMARRALTSFEVVTLVLKGKADHVLFPHVRSCVQWPWRAQRSTEEYPPEAPAPR